MDITHLFKAGVMTVKLQRKGELAAQPLDKKRILPKTGASQRDEFARQAKDACHKITTLRNVLLENRAAYMRIGQHLKNATHMTDEQRDLIDRESEKFVAFYTQHLAQMRADWKRAKRKKQQLQHIDAVLDLLEQYLRSVQQIYQEQKRYRVQHELETYRLLKLAADKKKIPVRPAGERNGRRRRKRQRHRNSTCTESTDDSSDEAASVHARNNNVLITDLEGDWRDDEDDDDDDNDDGKYDDEVVDNVDDNDNSALAAKAMELRQRHRQAQDAQNDVSGNSTSSTGELKATQSSQKVALDEDIQKSQQLVEAEAEAAGKLSPEDVQMFEQENVQLYQELQGLAEEVEQIEKNVVDIAQLQDIFTEKVSLQQHNIERIANAVVGATENVKDANEQIMQAIQRNAGLRVWSLFFLLVMSFALLFLDWYYD